MKTIIILMPISFICSLLSGLFGHTGIASILLAFGLCMLFSFLVVDTLARYFFSSGDEYETSYYDDTQYMAKKVG